MLVHLLDDACPDCGGPLTLHVETQGALVRHGGYGADRQVTTHACVCGWSVVAEVREIRPLVASSR